MKQSRATLEEVLEFANKVRKAGGGNPIDALMPAIPEDTTRCLIAKNLNFNCSVDGALKFEGGERWGMAFDPKDVEIRNRIANTLQLPTVDNDELWIVLPKPIGQVAADFDHAMEVMRTLDSARQDPEFADDIDEEDLALVKEMWPYIEASEKEALDLGALNDKGELIL